MSKALADRLRHWYANGEKKMVEICEREDAPEAVKDEVRRWYEQGHKRLDAIARAVEDGR